MKRLALSAALLLPLAALSQDPQPTPDATAPLASDFFALPSVAGTLRYSVSASESINSNYFGDTGVYNSTNLSANLAFLSRNKRDPFSAVFSGGRSWTGSARPSYNFFDLALAQTIAIRRWKLTLANSTDYLPGTASGGLSGVPGTGDLGVGAASDTATPQGVLTDYSTRVTNSTNGSVQRQLTGKTGLFSSGSFTLTRFTDDAVAALTQGLDSDSESSSLGISHRIDARNTIGGAYAFSHNSYVNNASAIARPAFASQVVSLTTSHQFNRKLGVSTSAGPQWTTIDTTPSSSLLSLFANITANYAGKFSRSTLVYGRTTNGGDGVVGGSLADNVSFSNSRTIGRAWLFAYSAAYTHTQNLPSAYIAAYSFQTVVTSVQLSRSMTRSLSTYASYTLEDQSNKGGAAAVDLFGGLSNVAGFGITYSPASVAIGRR
jgi:hypothetical protein